MADSNLLTLLLQLKRDRSPAAVEPAAVALANKAAMRRYPVKSAAATLRHHRKAARLDGATERAILERATALLAARPVAERPAEDPEFCGEERAATLLGIGIDELRQLMIDPVQRRFAGYPHWDGRQWRFPLAALRAATRHAFLASLPETDPCEDLLPPWCRRTSVLGEQQVS